MSKHFLRFGGQGTPTHDVTPDEMAVEWWYYLVMGICVLAVVGGMVISRICGG